MSIDVTTEKRFESDIEEFFLSPAGGYTHNQDAYDSQLGVYKDTLLRFIQKTQPKEWKRFFAAKQSGSGAEILSCVQ